MRLLVQKQGSGLHLDYVEIEPFGVVRLWGWSMEPELRPETFVVRQAGRAVLPTVIYRTARPDVAEHFLSEKRLWGFSAEFIRNLSPQRFEYAVRSLRGVVSDEEAKTLGQFQPDYADLLTTDRVLHREDIYSFGSPAEQVSPEVIELALALEPPLLDFGCGIGLLVRELRRRGHEAYGIELNRPPIVQGLKEEVRPYVTLYDGAFPLPFRDGQFESAIASEVIEHVPAYEDALREIRRVARSAFAITVPDMTSIPIGWQHGIVPWHLLESTHVNFFTYKSLRRILSPHYPHIQMYKLGAGDVNGSHLPTSVAAICRK